MGMTPTQKVEVLRAACCVAGVDKETSQSERVLLERLADGIGVGAVSLHAMIERSERDPNFYKSQFKVLREEPLECITVLLEVAVANGALKPEELEVLRGLATILGIDEPTFKNSMATAIRELGNGQE